MVLGHSIENRSINVGISYLLIENCGTIANIENSKPYSHVYLNRGSFRVWYSPRLGIDISVRSEIGTEITAYFGLECNYSIIKHTDKLHMNGPFKRHRACSIFFFFNSNKIKLQRNGVANTGNMVA